MTNPTPTPPHEQGGGGPCNDIGTPTIHLTGTTVIVECDDRASAEAVFEAVYQSAWNCRTPSPALLEALKQLSAYFKSAQPYGWRDQVAKIDSTLSRITGEGR